MKLGLFIMPLHPPERPHADCYELDLDLIQLADELGYEDAWIGEHFTNPWENVASPELIIAAALQRTRRIRLGTGVSCLPNHHPAVLAHRIAQLDHMARGRFMFGIGSGATAADTRMVGQEPADARDATRSSIELILRIWERAANGGGPGVSLSNGHWTTELPEQSELVRVHLAPYQRPHPPIAVAGLTRASGTLRIAGEQGWIPMSINIVPPGILRSHWEATVAGAESVGRAADRSLWRVTAGTWTPATSAARASTSQRPNPQHDATLAGSSGVWRQCVATAAARAHAGAPLLLAGEPGTGKLALATAVLRDLEPLSVVDAALSQLDGDPPGWLAGLRSRLEKPGAIVIQHVETLAPTVLALMAGVLDAAQRERQPCRVAVTATVAAGKLTGLSGLAARFGESVLVPPLRDHAEDVPELVRSAAAQCALAIPPRFDPRALQAMMRADWPGNIRELESTVRGLVTGARSTEIRPEHLGPQLRAG